MNQENHESGENPNRQSTDGKEKGRTEKETKTKTKHNKGEKE